MGGDYEDKVEAPAVKPAKTAGASSGDVVKIQGVRFHLSRGHVHFHDDDRKIKVYVPTPVWWNAWQKLRIPPGEEAVSWSYVDLDNESMIQITSGCMLESGAVRVAVVLDSYEAPKAYDRMWHALENFTTKSQKG